MSRRTTKQRRADRRRHEALRVGAFAAIDRTVVKFKVWSGELRQVHPLRLPGVS